MHAQITRHLGPAVFTVVIALILALTADVALGCAAGWDSTESLLRRAKLVTRGWGETDLAGAVARLRARLEER